MNMKDYQDYVRDGANPIYDQTLAILGLVGEVGELCEVGADSCAKGQAKAFLELESLVGKLCDIIKKVKIYSDMSKFEAKYGMTAENKAYALLKEIRQQLDTIEAQVDKGFIIETGAPVELTESEKDEALSEQSDILWQLALVFDKFGNTFEGVADYNVAKLNKRHGGAGKTASDGGGVR